MKEQVPTIRDIGKVMHRFAEITSTNSYARQLIANDEPVHGTVIMADNQTLGVGQKGKSWQSAAGKNLLCSIILRPSKSIVSQFYLNKSIAIAIANTVKQLTLKETKIKWPNDIYVEDQKIAGILIENFIKQNLFATSIVGIGLNVNQVIFQETLNATSLKSVSGKDYEIQSVAEQLFNQMQKQYNIYLAKDYDTIDNAYQQLLYKRNEVQVFKMQQNQFTGVIKGVDEFGLLEIEVAGEIQKFKNQEVEFVIQ